MPSGDDWRRWAGQAVAQLERLFARQPVPGTVTLNANAGSTVVANGSVAMGRQVWLEPMSASAAATRATTYVSAVGNGSFTISHSSSAATDRAWNYLVV
jgi:hypothetical protein